MVLGVEEMLWTLLRINPSQVSGIFLNDIVNLILLPSIVLIVFLDSAASWFLGQHSKWQHVVAVTFYLVLVVQGFYGVFATFAFNYIIIFLIFAFGFYAVSRFLRPEHGFRAGMPLGAVYEKSRAIKELEKQKEDLLRRKNSIRADYNNLYGHIPTGTDSRALGEMRKLMDDIDGKVTEIDSEIRKLKRII